MELIWSTSSFEELNKTELYQILRLRAEVFVVEQTCVYQDIDGKDNHCLHIMAWDQSQLVAYARIVPSTAEKRVSIGRVIIEQSYRGKKIGDLLMEECLKACLIHFPNEPLEMSAQKHLESYYNKHGFKKVGEPYLEDGIPHICMKN